MTENEGTKKCYPLLTMLVGLVSFLISGILAGLISLRTNEGMILILGAPIGSLLMLYFLHELAEDKNLAVVIRSLLGGFAGFFVGFIVGTLVAELIGLVIPSLRDMEQVKAQIVPNIVMLMVADAIFGALFGHLLYGRKSIRFFAFLCGIASIPFGILLSIPIHIVWIDFNQNILFTLVSFGTTTGLSMGLYRFIKLKSKR